MSGDFIVGRLSDLTEKMIPFFETYPILGVKAKDFEDFNTNVSVYGGSASPLTVGLFFLCFNPICSCAADCIKV
jgi:hypothetical protein